MNHHKTLILTTIIGSLGLLSCGGGGGGSSPPPDTVAPSISFSPTTLTVTGGQTGTSTLSVSDNAGIASGPTVTCTNGGTFSGTTFTAPNVTVNTTSICTASATDTSGNSASATLTVTIEPANQPPIAVIASPISEIDEGQMFTLDGSGSSDPEGTALTYAWSQIAGPAATLTAPSLPTLTVTLPEVTQDETLTFELRVSDGNLSNATSVDIIAKNVMPTAFNGEGGVSRLKALFLEADGNYRAVWDLGRQSFSMPTASKLFDPAGVQIGAQTDGVFFTGFIEWGGNVADVLKSGTEILYTNDVVRSFGLGPSNLLNVALAYHEGLVGGQVVGLGTEAISELQPNFDDFSFDSAATTQDTSLTTDHVVSLVTLNRDAVIGDPMLVDRPASDYTVTGIVRNTGGATSNISLDTSPNRMTDAAVAALTEGNFLGLYTVTEGGSENLYYARANIDGTNITSRVAVDLNPTSDQDEPHIARLSGGNAFMAWRDDSATQGDASGTAIKGRVIGADGSFLTGSFLINTAVTGDQSRPYVTALDNNRALIVWVDNGGATPQVRGQVFDAAGRALATEFGVDLGAPAADFDRFRTVALQSGTIVLGWGTISNGSFRVALDPLGR